MYETWLDFRSDVLSHVTKRIKKTKLQIYTVPSHVLYILLAAAHPPTFHLLTISPALKNLIHLSFKSVGIVAFLIALKFVYNEVFP